MKKLASFSILFFLTLTLFAQNYELIDKKDLKNYIEILASDSLEGRFTGTEGQKKAAKFLSSEYEKLNLVKFNNNSYLESFNVKKSNWNEIYIETDKKKLLNNEHISYIGSDLQQNEKEVQLVFGGYGSKEELNQVDVKAKLVLIFSKNMRSYYSLTEELIKRQAYGIVLANPTNEKQFSAMRRSLGSYRTKSRVSLPKKDSLTNTYFRFFKDFIISNDNVKDLIGVSINKLNKYIENQELALCPTPMLKIKVEKLYRDLSTENVVGILPGESDTTIYISAHYDHLGKSENGIYRGADDNASGTAALLELAELFSKMEKRKYQMIFIAATAEEVGLIGSYIHVNSETFNASKVLVNFNIDMISRIDEKNDKYNASNSDYLYANGVGIYPQIKPYLVKADEKFKDCHFDYSLNNGDKVTWSYSASDHYNFHKKNIPAIMFFSGKHKDYHSVTDTPDKINYDLLTNRVRLIAHSIYELQKVD